MLRESDRLTQSRVVPGQALVDRPPFVQPSVPVHFRTGTNAFTVHATVPVYLKRAMVPVHAGQRSRLLPPTGTNALATNTWRTARHWSRFVATTGTVALAI